MRLRSVLAARLSGAPSGALPDAPAAGQRSQQNAVRLSASSAAVSQTRLACSSPEGRWRSACPSFDSFRRSSIWARWRWKCSIQAAGCQWMSVRMKLYPIDGVDLPLQRELQLLGVDCLQASGALQASDLRGAEDGAADDQPQRLVLPAIRAVGGLGDLCALHVERVLPGILADRGQCLPHRLASGYRHGEPRALTA